MQLDSFFERLKSRTRRLFTKSNWNILRELIRANLKADDHNSVLGVFWSILGPVTLLLVMYLIFATRFGAKMRTYPLYLLVGIVSINFFIAVTTSLTRIFTTHKNFILNSVMPRENFIFASMSIEVYKFIIQLIICGVLSIIYGVFSWKSAFLLLPLLIVYLVCVLGVGLILALIHCFVRDMHHLWSIISRILFFASPIFYTLESLPPLTRKLVYWVNPATPFLVSFHDIFMGTGKINVAVYGHSLILGGVFFILGYGLFIIFEGRALEQA